MTLAAAILDVDGVLTSTAALHERVWKQLLDAELRRRGDPHPWARRLYRRTEGRPRFFGRPATIVWMILLIGLVALGVVLFVRIL